MTPGSNTERPKIKPPLQSFDVVFEIAALLGLAALWWLAASNYNQLPERIPTHFGFDGNPDGFGPKSRIWLLPVLGLVLYLFMGYLARKPHTYNYAVKITPENAEREYSLATRILRGLRAFIMLLFAYLVWGTVTTAQGSADGLSTWALLITLVVTLGTTFGYVARNKTQP